MVLKEKHHPIHGVSKKRKSLVVRLFLFYGLAVAVLAIVQYQAIYSLPAEMLTLLLFISAIIIILVSAYLLLRRKS
ncbi:MAG: hypothetical protein Q8R53_01550 [Nanoarchaeota archaeon]|nr:hypothetical protein [Nanoarchaeota archaeon]